MSRRDTKYQRRREGVFFIAMALVMALVVFIGFARSLFLRFWLEPDPLASSEPIFYVHGVVTAVWMVLLIVQPALIRVGRVKQHRRVGLFGAALATVVVLMGFWVALVAAGRPDDFALPPLDVEFLGVILGGIVMFGLLVGLAIVLRGDGQYHKRLMILATVNMLQAAIVRIPLDFITEAGALTSFLLADIFVVPLVVWDVVVLKRIHPATLWGGLAIVASLPLRLWMSGTESWLTMAGWAIDLVN